MKCKCMQRKKAIAHRATYYILYQKSNPPVHVTAATLHTSTLALHPCKCVTTELPNHHTHFLARFNFLPPISPCFSKEQAPNNCTARLPFSIHPINTVHQPKSTSTYNSTLVFFFYYIAAFTVSMVSCTTM